MWLQIYVILTCQYYVMCYLDVNRTYTKLMVNTDIKCSDRCVTKCCPKGMVFTKVKDERGVSKSLCASGADSIFESKQLIHDRTALTGYVYLAKTFKMLYGKPCKKMYVANHQFYMQEANKMFLLLLFFVASCASEQPCLDYQSVDISDVPSLKDGSVVQDGVVFAPKYVYSKKVDGEMKKFGCLCQTKDCFRKCCPLGSVFIAPNCTEMPSMDVLLNDGLKTYYKSRFIKNVDLRNKSLDLLYGKACRAVYLEDSEWYIQEDGKLYVKIPSSIPDVFIYGPDKYCIDTFVSDTKEPHLNALICFVQKPEQNNYALSSSCMLISCFFILLTVAVYAWVPELRNLHGMVLMAYLLCFFVGFLFLATMQILILKNDITQDLCTILTFIIYFSLLSAFFWLNIMCYDIWWTFSGKRAHGRSGTPHKRFAIYAIYAFGVPTLLTIILAALEFSDLPIQHPLLPKLRIQGCFLYGNSKLLYLYGPIVILCVANMTFFGLTAFKIWKIKKETQMLRGRESSTHDQDRKETQRFTLYVKLFTVMGINWILEVVSSFYPDADFFWQFSDAYNVLVGFIIFIIFVCKKKTWRLIKKRYRQLRGDPLSRTQTTTSSTTRIHSTSRDDMRMNSIKK